MTNNKTQRVITVTKNGGTDQYKGREVYKYNLSYTIALLKTIKMTYQGAKNCYHYIPDGVYSESIASPVATIIIIYLIKDNKVVQQEMHSLDIRSKKTKQLKTLRILNKIIAWAISQDDCEEGYIEYMPDAVGEDIIQNIDEARITA